MSLAEFSLDLLFWMCTLRSMTADFDAREFAREWIEAWNSHDLDTILSHYADGVVLTSPAAARLLKNSFSGACGRYAAFQGLKPNTVFGAFSA